MPSHKHDVKSARRPASSFDILLFCVVALWPVVGTARPTVAVAPFANSSGTEYAWIGPAIAEVLSLRLLSHEGVNAMTVRQVFAAMREERLGNASLLQQRAAEALGRNLGVDLLFTGNVDAAWPFCELTLHVVEPKAKRLRRTLTVNGTLDQLAGLEVELAKLLGAELAKNGVTTPLDLQPGIYNSANVLAWRLAAKAALLLNAQSLSPRAADPRAPAVVDTAKLDEAKAYLSEALSIDPNYTEALALLGTAQALRGEPPQSLDKIASTRFCATAELGRAYGHVRAGRLDEATAGLERILNAHPGFLHARGYLGELLALRGQHDKAIAVFDAYLAEVPAQPWVLVQRGYSKSRQKDFAGAIADTEAALTAAPGSPAFRLELASRYVDARKLDAAEATLNTLMGEQPDLALALTRLGYIKLLQNKDDQAIALTERALRYRGNAQRPRDIAYAHLNLARAYGHRGDLEKSLRFLAEALRLADVPLTEVEADPLLVSLRADPRYQRLTSTTNQSQRTQ